MDEVEIAIVTDETAIAGQDYTINCTVNLPDGITAPLQLQWQDSSGPITAGEGISVYELSSTESVISTLEFHPLRLSHGGHFICEATIISSTPPFTLTKVATLDIVVEGKNSVLVHLQYISK